MPDTPNTANTSTDATPLASEQKPLNLDGYYIGFEATCRFEIDLILSAVARAGKAYHNTADWNDDTPAYDERFRGETPVDWIQHAANDAADAIAALSASPAPSGQGVSAADVLQTIVKQFETDEAQGYRSSTRTYVLDMAKIVAAPAPSCAPGEVERLHEAFSGSMMLESVDSGLWSLQFAFGRGDGARDRMREAADVWRKAMLAALSPQGLDAKEGNCSFCPRRASTEVSDESDVFPCCNRCADAWKLDPGFAKDATPSQRLDAATVERVRAATVKMRARAGANPTIAEGLSVTLSVADAEAILTALATEPHQHGGKGA